MSRVDEQQWEWTSTTAQSAATAAGCRSKRVSEQFSPTPVAPGSAAEKKRPQPAASTAGRRSEGEWEQLGPLLVDQATRL